MTDAAPEPSTSRRSGEPGCSRWSWPTTSSSVAGRILTASGADAPTGPPAPSRSLRRGRQTDRRTRSLLTTPLRDGAVTTVGVTKSISSSTRPMSAGSRSFQSRTRPLIRCHALAMSACWVCGQPSARHTPCFQSVPRGIDRPRRDAEPAGLDGLPDVDERMADDERVRAARSTADRVGDAGLLRAGDEVVDEHTEPAAGAGPELLDDPDEIVDAAEVFDHHALDRVGRRPTPVRRVRRRGGPRRRCGWPAPLWRVRRGTATEPDAVRAGAFGAGAPRRGEDHRPAVDEIAGADRERFPAAVPVLELHPAVLDADHRAHVTRLRRPRRPCRFPPAARWSGVSRVRIVGEHVGAIAISHRVIVGSAPVLLNRDTAEGIANGSITLVLRRWDAPRAKPGGTQRTVGGHHPHRRRRRVSGQLPGHRRAGARRRLSGRQDRRKRSSTAGLPSTPT